MAVIQFFGKFTCAGSIIKSDLVITAASCLQLAYNNRFFRENPSFLSVRVGSTFYKGGGEVIPVLEVYFHPRYNPKNLRHNICLLRLTRRLKFRRRSRKVKKIDIDRTHSGLPMTTNGITVVGWGAQDSSNIIYGPWKNRLAFATLDIYPTKECQHIYSDEYVTRYNFCAGFMSKGGGACNQDVGGPGIVNGKLAGVISFGSPACGTPDAPTVFTKLGFYSDWIQEIMEQDVPHFKKPTTIKESYTVTRPTIHKLNMKTKFKISPVDETQPMEITALKTEEELFKEFLKTMYTSSEVNEYLESESIKDITGTMVRNLEKNQNYHTDDSEEKEENANDGTINKSLKSQKNTKEEVDVEEYDNFAQITKSPLDYNYPASDNVEIEYTNIDSTVHELLSTKQSFELKGSRNSGDDVSINLDEASENPKKSISMNRPVMKEEENVLSPPLENAISSEESGPENDIISTKKEVKHNSVNGSVLNSLYFSDRENDSEINDEVDEYGLSIPVERFTDWTYRNNANGTKNLDILSEDLLNETIE